MVMVAVDATVVAAATLKSVFVAVVNRGASSSRWWLRAVVTHSRPVAAIDGNGGRQFLTLGYDGECRQRLPTVDS